MCENINQFEKINNHILSFHEISKLAALILQEPDHETIMVLANIIEQKSLDHISE